MSKSFLAGFVMGIILTFVLFNVFQTNFTIPTITQTSSILGVYFSPNGNVKDVIIYWISRANKSIHILIYSFTLRDVADALIKAKQRGVNILIVFEKSEINEYSQYFRLRDAGIIVKNDTNPALMHDKVMIIDSIIVITGSYNWSYAAENKNNENLIIIKSSYVAQKYEEIFNQIFNASV